MSRKLEDIQKRHALIKSLIASQAINNQTQLVKLLRQKGIKVTQATLSRDLAELGVVRIPTSDGLVYKLAIDGGEGAIKERIAEEIISIESNECVVLIKTFLGRAPGVAVFIDKHQDPEILGTIAGDDTIIVVPKTIKNIKKVIEQLKIILGIK